MKYRNMRMRYLAARFGGRVYAKADVASLLSRAETLAGEIRALRGQLADAAGREGAKSADGKAIYEQIAEKKALRDQLIEAASEEMGQQAQRVATSFNQRLAGVEAANREALGGLYRALISGAEIPQETIQALSLPTVWAPETAGEALARTVQAILQEREGTV